MLFRTVVDIPPSAWKIEPLERMLFVGSCFADHMGRRFQQEKFRTVVNPYGVMYNPASILHTVEKLIGEDRMPFRPDRQGTAVFTLGTNHVYIWKATGEIVDNCRKLPHHLFEEQELSVGECTAYLQQAVDTIRKRFPLVRFILTVSPIRYRKYGYHGSRLSKSTLLLATDRLVRASDSPSGGPNGQADAQPREETKGTTVYFPAYEIMNDELRDYRFYKEDMLHPTDQAVEYIYERMGETFFSPSTFAFLQAWKPIREALSHRPFNPDSEEYRLFLKQAKARERTLLDQYATE